MKTTLFALFVSLLMVGCGGPDLDDKETLDEILAEALDFDTDPLQRRGKKGEMLSYAPNQQTPYTGWVKRMWENGQVSGLHQYKDGKQDGLDIDWYKSGQKAWESNWKDGKRHGPWVRWYENGQKEREENYKEGKLWSSVCWKLNGEKCPETNVKDGNGVYISYSDNGIKSSRWVYENGQKKARISYHENGQKKREGNYKNGKQDGLWTHWYMHVHGKVRCEETFKNGKLMSVGVWKPNGEKCPLTYINEDGNGVLIVYGENSLPTSRLTYKDGKLKLFD